MNIRLICIGKLKEAYWREAVNEYMKRLKAYCNPQIIELKESKQSGEGEAAERMVREREGEEILSRITQNMYVITLEIKGKKLSSEQLAEKIEELSIEGKSDVASAEV